jgi:hypothetical protein
MKYYNFTIKRGDTFERNFTITVNDQPLDLTDCEIRADFKLFNTNLATTSKGAVKLAFTTEDDSILITDAQAGQFQFAPTEINLAQWLGAIESMGWIVQWPEAEGTKESIVGELKSTPTWAAADSKLRKEVLARRLGRVKTLAAVRPAAGGAGAGAYDL